MRKLTEHSISGGRNAYKGRHFTRTTHLFLRPSFPIKYPVPGQFSFSLHFSWRCPLRPQSFPIHHLPCTSYPTSSDILVIYLARWQSMTLYISFSKVAVVLACGWCYLRVFTVRLTVTYSSDANDRRVAHCLDSSSAWRTVWGRVLLDSDEGTGAWMWVLRRAENHCKVQVTVGFVLICKCGGESRQPSGM